MFAIPFNWNSEEYLKQKNPFYEFDLSFVDPPFNQDKTYRAYKDKLPEREYWDWMTRICGLIYDNTSIGGSIYFMQREKNTQFVLEALKDTGWTLQNLIVWKKKSSAVPLMNKYSKQYQIIAFATKGKRPRLFNKLRIDPPLLVTEKYERENGMYVTDVWDDIREMTSGFFAGDEAIRDEDGSRFHEQQSPIALLLRIILSSTKKGDFVFDPFAGTGTTLTVAKQLQRDSFGMDVDPLNVKLIKERVSKIRPADNIERFREDYFYTKNLNEIWGSNYTEIPMRYRSKVARNSGLLEIDKFDLVVENKRKRKKKQ